MDKKIFVVVVSFMIGNVVGYKVGYQQGYGDSYYNNHSRINWFKYCITHKKGV